MKHQDIEKRNLKMQQHMNMYREVDQYITHDLMELGPLKMGNPLIYASEMYLNKNKKNKTSRRYQIFC